ncbi:hypothetical protein [Streptomyces sp. NPDC005244]|uniref:hypothetical protein n=1 Tax=Streptomyces sp. NPDC005244 TaxID=3364708 RepID=UPI003686C069
MSQTWESALHVSGRAAVGFTAEAGSPVEGGSSVGDGVACRRGPDGSEVGDGFSVRSGALWEGVRGAAEREASVSDELPCDTAKVMPKVASDAQATALDARARR